MFSSMLCGTMPRSAPRRKSEPRGPVVAQQQACGTTSRSCITFTMSMICGMTPQLHLLAIIGNAAEVHEDQQNQESAYHCHKRRRARPLPAGNRRERSRGAGTPAKPVECMPLPLSITSVATVRKRGNDLRIRVYQTTLKI